MARNFVIWYIGLLSLSSAHAQQNCKLKKDENGIKVYACHTDSSKFKSIKAEVVLKGVTKDQLADFLLDIDNYHTWQYNMTESKVLKKVSDTRLIYRSVIDAPWPVSNREMIAELELTSDSLTNTFKIVQRNAKYEYPKDKDLVRVPFSIARWLIKEENENLRIDYSLQVDPGGSVPVWLVNMAIAEGPYASFGNLKEQLSKKSSDR